MMLHRLLRIAQACLVLSFFTFVSCGPDPELVVEPVKSVKDFDSKVLQEWQDLFLEIERYAEVYRPCPAARMSGYLGLAAYEACISGMPEYQSLAPRIPGLQVPRVENGKEYHWPTVVNNVYASLYKNFFAKVRSADYFKITALESSLNIQFSNAVNSEIFTRSRDFGRSVAENVWEFSKTDAFGHDKYTEARPSNYTPPTGPGKWQPTPPGGQGAMFPFWGKARYFAIKEEDKTGRPPLAYSEDKKSYYYTQALEVYTSTSPQSAENQWIAEFWSDDVLGFTFSPPARWIAILNQVLVQDKVDLERAVMGAVKVGLALNDASVAAWHSKFYYNVERPVSYIHKVINPNWNVAPLTSTGFLKSTPSFPAYPSGHSTFGAAAAEALSQIFGYNYVLTDRCHEARTDFNGKPRTFSSFYQMADENAYSRIWLGVHFRMDCEEGLRMGYNIGRRVGALPFKKVL